MKTALRILLILALIGAFSTLFFVPINGQKPEVKQVKIVTTIFPAYDFARTLSADTEVDLKMLIQPGSDIHSYDPSPQDIIKVKESDIFIYNGGESEHWVDKILNEIDKNNTIVVRMTDSVDPLHEPQTDASEQSANDAEYDEHIWTSPKNVMKIAKAIAQALINRSPNDTSIIQHNLEQFETALAELDEKFDHLARQKSGTIIVADRFPFYYFIQDYKFDYVAALPGCSEQTEASAKTIAELIHLTSKSPEKIIFTIELSSTKIAQTVAKATGAKTLTWHSVHNVSQSDFESGKTYLDYMNENLNNLSKALHDRPTNQ